MPERYYFYNIQTHPVIPSQILSNKQDEIYNKLSSSCNSNNYLYEMRRHLKVNLCDKMNYSSSTRKTVQFKQRPRQRDEMSIMLYASRMQPKIFSDEPSRLRTRKSTGIPWGVSGASLVSPENFFHRVSQPKRGDVSSTLEIPVICH